MPRDGGFNHYIFTEQRLLHMGAELDIGAANNAGLAVLERFAPELEGFRG